MNKNAENLLMGAALAALAYALYRHYKPAGASTPARPFMVTNPLNPNIGVSYDSTNPGYVSSLSDLLAGAVHDINTGHATPDVATNSDIIGSAVSDIYGTETTSAPATPSVVGGAPSWLSNWQQAQE